MCVCVTKSCLTLCNLVSSSLPGPSVNGIFLARILEWVAIFFSRDIPDPGIKPASPALTGRFFTTLPPGELISMHDFYFKICVDLVGCVRSHMRHAGCFIIANKLLAGPWLGTGPRPPPLEAWSLSRWTTREVPMHNLSNAVSSREITGRVRMKPIEGTDNRDACPPGGGINRLETHHPYEDKKRWMQTFRGGSRRNRE